MYKMPRSSSSSSKPSKPPVNYHPPVSFTNPYSSVGTVVPSQPTLGQSIKQGLGFGAGSAIAHRIFNPFPVLPSTDTKKEHPCEKERMAFETCMKTKSADDFCGEQQMSYTQCIRLTNQTN